MIRESLPGDARAIFDLYQATAREPGGLARTASEYVLEDIEQMVIRARTHGLSLALFIDERLAGEIHGMRPSPSCFAHVMGDLSMAVAPEFQGQGIGSRLMEAFLAGVRMKWPQILRVELFARESNQRAVRLYQRAGFEIEGVLRGRIRGDATQPESDLVMGFRYNDWKGVVDRAETAA